MGKLTINCNEQGHVLGALLIDDEGKELGLTGKETIKMVMDYSDEVSYEFCGRNIGFNDDYFISADVIFYQID